MVGGYQKKIIEVAHSPIFPDIILLIAGLGEDVISKWYPKSTSLPFHSKGYVAAHRKTPKFLPIPFLSHWIMMTKTLHPGTDYRCCCSAWWFLLLLG
jgi:hypothetical protein